MDTTAVNKIYRHNIIRNISVCCNWDFPQILWFLLPIEGVSHLQREQSVTTDLRTHIYILRLDPEKQRRKDLPGLYWEARGMMM